MPLGENSRLLYALQEMARRFPNFASATAKDLHLQPAALVQNGWLGIYSSSFTFRVCELGLESITQGHV